MISAPARARWAERLALPTDSRGLVPNSAVRIGASPRLRLDGLVREARLRFDLPDEPEPPAGLPPRPELKTSAGEFPTVDRRRKGDPIVALRPTLSRRAGELRRAAAPSGARLLFEAAALAAPPEVLAPGLAGDVETEPVFVPWQAPDRTVTGRAVSAQSPSAASSGSTGAARGATTGRSDGATPAVSRAVALSSTTPAPADSTPIEIAAAPVSQPALALARPERDVSVAAKSDPAEKPRYTDLINPDNLSREQRCLAEAVYFEARSEPEEGQAAVAQVVLNRARSGLYPSSVCGVVYQNRHRHLACQFTFACEGKSLRITDSDSGAPPPGSRRRCSRARPIWPMSARRRITTPTTSGPAGRAS
jgi:spore germination cell wall hydrolase CwlJ-like protein